MTQVSFHLDVLDPAHHACRLLRKASRAGSARLLLLAPTELVPRVSERLWALEPHEFLAHAQVPESFTELSSLELHRLKLSRLWLSDRLEPALALCAQLDLPLPEVLVHLGLEPLPGVARFQRVVEVVSPDPDHKAQARKRWKQYALEGHVLEKFEMTA